MEQLFSKLKEYLHMDAEIPFEEFSDYYKQVISKLNGGFSEFDRRSCLQARYICAIVQANADSRAKRSKANAKAYKKMAAKCAFWLDAINYRLVKEGLSQAEIEQALAAISEEVDAQPA